MFNTELYNEDTFLELFEKHSDLPLNDVRILFMSSICNLSPFLHPLCVFYHFFSLSLSLSLSHALSLTHSTLTHTLSLFVLFSLSLSLPLPPPSPFRLPRSPNFTSTHSNHNNTHIPEPQGELIHWTAFRGYAKLTKYLIEEKNCDCDKVASGTGAWTPLHKAVDRGHDKVVEVLVSNGAYINGADECGITALMRASLNGFSSIAKLLLDAGVDVNAKGPSNRTALHYASIGGSSEIVDLLLEHGALQTKETESGMYPIHRAALSIDPKIFKSLLEHGASATSPTGQGDHSTPLHMVAKFQFR